MNEVPGTVVTRAARFQRGARVVNVGAKGGNKASLKTCEPGNSRAGLRFTRDAVFVKTEPFAEQTAFRGPSKRVLAAGARVTSLETRWVAW